MDLAQYFTEFIIYSFLGWIWESIYCTIKEKRWQDRGFLFGPICPIYGSVVVITSIVFKEFPVLTDPDFPIWAVFLICMLGSAVAEYATSWFLEKRFHARWWDYSNIPLNINGRICIPASLGFGLAGILIVKYLIPAVSDMHSLISPLFYEFSSLIFAIMLGADLALTESSLSALLKQVEDMHNEFNEKAQENYEKMAEAPRIFGKRIKEMTSYVRMLGQGQRSILKKIKLMPDTKHTDIQNISRIAFWQSLKDAAHTISKGRDLR
ncbi:MAG: putative ABC transporter permease [Lachnospiraceae bacterium]|nr:putative ABC transporter permease [Lachnospiraceae bacterium]